MAPSLYPILSDLAMRCSATTMLPPLAAHRASPLASLAGRAAPRRRPTLDPLKPCYVSAAQAPTQRETIDVHATGFTPASPRRRCTIDGVARGDRRRRTSTATVDGRRRRRRSRATGERPFTLALTERENPANAVTAHVEGHAASSVELRPRAAPTVASACASAAAASRSRRAGLRALRVRAARCARRCGSARRRPAPAGSSRVKRRQIPVQESPRVGVWTMQFDQQRALRPEGRDRAVPLPIDPTVAASVKRAGSGALDRASRVKRSSPSAASTSIRSPAANSPLSRPSASGSTRRLEITRLSGRAPYVGS